VQVFFFLNNHYN